MFHVYLQYRRKSRNVGSMTKKEKFDENEWTPEEKQPASLLKCQACSQSMPIGEGRGIPFIACKCDGKIHRVGPCSRL